MKKNLLSSITKIIAAGLFLLFIGFLSCDKPVSPLITGRFGGNDTFSRIGEAECRTPSRRFSVPVYSGTGNGKPYRLIGPLDALPHGRFLLAAPENLFWFDDSPANCSVSEQKVSVKYEALLTPCEITEKENGWCPAYTVTDSGDAILYTLSLPETSETLQISLPKSLFGKEGK